MGTAAAESGVLETPRPKFGPPRGWGPWGGGSGRRSPPVPLGILGQGTDRPIINVRLAME